MASPMTVEESEETESAPTLDSLSTAVQLLQKDNSNMRQYLFALLRNQSALMGVIGEEAAVYRNIPGCQRITAKMDVLTNLSSLLDKRIETMTGDSPYDPDLCDDDVLLDLLRRMTSAERKRLSKLLNHELTKDNALALKMKGKQWGSSNAAAAIGSATVDALASSLVDPLNEEDNDNEDDTPSPPQESTSSDRPKRSRSTAKGGTPQDGGKKKTDKTTSKDQKRPAPAKKSQKKQPLDPDEQRRKKEIAAAKAAETRKRKAAAAAAAKEQQSAIVETPLEVHVNRSEGQVDAATGGAPPSKLGRQESAADGGRLLATPSPRHEVGATVESDVPQPRQELDGAADSDPSGGGPKDIEAPATGTVSVGVFTASWEKVVLRKGDFIALSAERSPAVIITCPPETKLLNIPVDWLEKYIEQIDEQHDVADRFTNAKTLGEAVAAFMLLVADAFVTELNSEPAIFDGVWDADADASTAKEFNVKQGVFGGAFLRVAMHYIAGPALPADIALSALRVATRVARKGLHRYRAGRTPSRGSLPPSKTIEALDM